MGKQTEEFWVKFGADNSQYDRAMSNTAKHHEGFLEGERKIEGATRSFAQSLGTAAGSADLLGAAANSLEDTFRGSLGISIAVAAGLALKSVIEEDAKELDKLSKEMQEMGKIDGRWQIKSFEDLGKEVENARSMVEKLSEEEAKLADQNFLKRGVRYATSGSQIEESLEGLKQAAQDKVLEAQKETVLLEKEHQKILEKQSRELDYQAEKERQKQARLIEIAKVEKVGGKDLVAAVNQRFALEDKIEKNKQEANAREVSLKMRLLDIEKAGWDVEKRQAEEVAQAKRDAYLLETDPIKKEQLKYESAAARQAADLIKQKSDMEGENYDSQMRLAKMQGDADDKHLAALKEEERMLRESLAKAEGESPEAHAADLGLIKNRQAQEEARMQAMRANSQDTIGNIGANKGFGPAAELQAQKDILEEMKLQLINEQLSQDFDKHHIASLQQAIALQEKAIKQAEVEKEIQDIQTLEKINEIEIDRTSNAEHTKRRMVMEAQLSALDRQIAAMQKLNPELAKALQLDKERLLNEMHQADRMENMGKSDRAIHQRMRAEHKQSQKESDYNKRTGETGNRRLIDIQRDMGGQVIGGTDPDTGKRISIPQGDPMDRKLPGMDNAPHLGDQFKRDTEDFRKKFQPKPAEPDGPPAPEKPQAQDPWSKIGSKLDELKAEIIKAIAQ